MIDICLATYNGESFLREQLDSILRQTYKDWHLYIRDDGSLDTTNSIIQEYKKFYPEQISVISDEKGNLGFIQNFNEILGYTSADYIALCDQDDLWLPDKLSKLMEEMSIAEKNSTDAKAILIYTDFSYIDEYGTTISLPFFKSIKKNHRWENANIMRALFYGTASGCLLFFNKKLLHLSGKIPRDFTLGHDYWFFFIALLGGTTVFLDEITVYRRIHKGNTSGVREVFPVRKTIINSKRISARINTATLLLDKIKEQQIPSCYEPNLKKLATLETASFLKRNKFYFGNKLLSHDLLLSLYVYVNIVFYRP